ncbi:MAG: hypothetical protein E4H10_17045 [Bacteroidia bacterium]|nr:MAG: hypothetical protein E4H10_17045 [Bacteroidia bacterium]
MPGAVSSGAEMLNESMDQEQFHIDFERSGGFTGGASRVKIDSRELDSEETELLKQLIGHSGFFEAFVLENKFLNMPDQFSYQITIEHMGKRRTLELTDGSIPDLFRPLINYLVRVARKNRRY